MAYCEVIVTFFDIYDYLKSPCAFCSCHMFTCRELSDNQNFLVAESSFAPLAACIARMRFRRLRYTSGPNLNRRLSELLPPSWNLGEVGFGLLAVDIVACPQSRTLSRHQFIYPTSNSIVPSISRHLPRILDWRRCGSNTGALYGISTVSDLNSWPLTLRTQLKIGTTCSLWSTSDYHAGVPGLYARTSG